MKNNNQKHKNKHTIVKPMPKVEQQKASTKKLNKKQQQQAQQ